MLTKNESPPNGQTEHQNQDILLKSEKDAVLILTMNRPENRNSLSESLLKALISAFDDVVANQSIRAIILTGNGPAFSAGHDMKELTEQVRNRVDHRQTILIGIAHGPRRVGQVRSTLVGIGRKRNKARRG